METKQLLNIARKIEKLTNSYVPGTVGEVTARIEAAASHCKNRREAARAIAEDVYNYRFDDEWNSLDEQILNA